MGARRGQGLSRTPIDTQGFSSALRLMETTCADSFELFYGLFRYNPHSHSQLRKLRESFAEVERQVSFEGRVGGGGGWGGGGVIIFCLPSSFGH